MKCKNLFFIIFIIFLTACSSSDVNKSNSKEALLLNELKERNDDGDSDFFVISKINTDIKNIKDKTIKNELLSMANDIAINVIKNEDSSQIRYFFEIFDIEKIDNPNDIKFFSLLDKKTQKSLLAASGYNVTKRVFLEKKGYKIEFMDEYHGVTIGEYSNSVPDILKNSNSPYEELLSIKDALFNVDNSIIIDSTEGNNFETGKVKRIFKIIDSNGIPVNPKNVLADYEPYISQEINVYNVAKEKEIQEYLDQNQRELEESTTIRIGMTTDEVIERRGEPEDINRTITANGTDEQWVYSNVYLYFENEVLVTIQD